MTNAAQEPTVVLPWCSSKGGVWDANYKGRLFIVRRQIPPEKGFTVSIDGRYMGERSTLEAAQQWATLLVD